MAVFSQGKRHCDHTSTSHQQEKMLYTPSTIRKSLSAPEPSTTNAFL
jgi:hypothetical protein